MHPRSYNNMEEIKHIYFEVFKKNTEAILWDYTKTK